MSFAQADQAPVLWPQALVACLCAFVVGLAPSSLYAARELWMGGLGIARDEANSLPVPATILFLVGLVAGPALSRWLGIKRLALLASLLFTIASLAGALATSPIVFAGVLAARGLADGLMLCFGLGFLATTPPAGRRAGLLGLLLCIYLIGGALGPILGGTLADNISWRWTSLVFAPIGLVVMGLQALVVTNARDNDLSRIF